MHIQVYIYIYIRGKIFSALLMIVGVVVKSHDKILEGIIFGVSERIFILRYYHFLLTGNTEIHQFI